MDEDRPDGLTLDEALTALRAYIEDGIDFLSVIRGTIESDATLAKVIPSMGTPSAPFLDFAGEIKRRLDVPVMHASRIADVATARHAVREGLLDLVGMTRAQIADPHLVAKVAAGDEDRIRPCVGANYCLDAIYESGDAKCIHNPATGREQTLPHTVPPAAERKKAVVVGAGPAGLEAARVLGERGHQVVVFEAGDLPGGQMRLAACDSPPARPDRHRRLARRGGQGLGVEFRYGVLAEAADRPRGTPRRRARRHRRPAQRLLPPEGADLVSDTWDVMGGALRPRGQVLVYDDNGAEPGLDATELLARRGAAIEFVTPERTLAPDVGSMNSPAYLRAFAEHDVAHHPGPPAGVRTPHGSGDGRLRDAAQRVRRHESRAARRPRGRRARHAAERRPVLRPGPRIEQPRRASNHPALLAVRAADGRPPTPRAGSSCSASGTPSPAATSTPRCYDALRLCLADLNRPPHQP